jgi:chromosome segregation protein
VYIKYLELSRFKSFGSTTGIPLLQGFTVVSGPNGSGKSNILDALLFCLGLSSSKGMRADRLPDLVNQNYAQKGRTAEAQVKVIFALDDGREWAVTRKLRVTQQGTYTSTYYMNDMPCTLGELHEQLSKFHIYPEGYNIVLQGDVTGIISMNPRDRRSIIDELAGVGEFDRKINTAKEKLAEVKQQEERFRIVEQELKINQQKLQGDRLKAEKYQALRQELHSLEELSVVLQHQHLLNQIRAKSQEQEQITAQNSQLDRQLQDLFQQITQAQQEQAELQQQIRSLGEEEYLQLTAIIANKQAESKSLERQAQDLRRNQRVCTEQITHMRLEIDKLHHQLQQSELESEQVRQRIATLEELERSQVAELLVYRQEAQAVGETASLFLQEQSQLFQKIESYQNQLIPQRQELTRLEESLHQWNLQLANCELELAELPDSDQVFAQYSRAQQTLQEWEQKIQDISAKLSHAQQQKQLCQETSDRLWQEQRLKSRQLDKLEAQQQAQREVQGTRAVQLILNANLQGVHGMVAQLATVETAYQTALEICAGNRLGFIVVDNEAVVSQAIQLLKQQQGGRATFLPLNKMKPMRSLSTYEARQLGAIDYAINLLTFPDIYADVFAFVFGNTLVYANFQLARPHIGNYRMVTLEGELLETTGAISGGSLVQKGSLHFGKSESLETAHEVNELKRRLAEIDTTLRALQTESQACQAKIDQYERELKQARTAHSETQRIEERWHGELNRTTQAIQRLQGQRQKLQHSIHLASSQIATLKEAIAQTEESLSQERQRLAELEQKSNHQQWQILQQQLSAREADLQRTRQELGERQQQQLQISSRRQLELSQMAQLNQHITELERQHHQYIQQIAELHSQIQAVESDITALLQQRQAIEARIQDVKQAREQCDHRLQELQQTYQQQSWQLEKNQLKLAEISQAILDLQSDITVLTLPEPMPVPPEHLTFSAVQEQKLKLEKKIQAMEPVNMLAIAEYDATTARLDELSRKLATLAQECAELLLRIENFTTLRQRAFMEAFNAVNQNFQTIFAELSDGDGYLQLENPSDPLTGGLNLVAHPKGKPVQHLSSMSGGEKSLTALSFIFALQRYRPSPFYAFDEVDMFLDGSNVERLARMVQKQAQLAQFIVVSLRRPMIDAADRTIGVTQARGAYTQVLGLERNKSA